MVSVSRICVFSFVRRLYYHTIVIILSFDSRSTESLPKLKKRTPWLSCWWHRLRILQSWRSSFYPLHCGCCYSDRESMFRQLKHIVAENNSCFLLSQLGICRPYAISHPQRALAALNVQRFHVHVTDALFRVRTNAPSYADLPKSYRALFHRPGEMYTVFFYHPLTCLKGIIRVKLDIRNSELISGNFHFWIDQFRIGKV